MLGKGLHRLFQRPQAMLYACWGAVLIGLLATLGYRVFLRPEFGIFIALGAAVLAVLATVEMRREPGHDDFRSLSGLGVLFIPLLFLIRTPSFTLDSYALSKRLTASWQTAGADAAASGGAETSATALRRAAYTPVRPSAPGSAPAEPDTIGAKEKREEIRESAAAPSPEPSTAENERAAAASPEADEPAEEVTLTLLSMAPGKFTNHRVSVIGMVQHNSGVKPYLGADSFVLFRFLIFCCAADAQPLASGVQLAGPQATENNGWVEVEGVYDVQDTDRGPLPVIRKAKVRKIEKPEQEYLY